MVHANVTLNQIKFCSSLLVKLQHHFALCQIMQIFLASLQGIKRSKKTTKSSVKKPKLTTGFAGFKGSLEPKAVVNCLYIGYVQM